MRIKLFIITLFLFCFDLFAQSAKDKTEYSKALSYFATGNSFNSLGSFASLSTSDNTLNASFFFLDDSKGMYTIDVKAGATQGFFTLFDEGKLNSNVSVGFAYRKIIGKKNYVGFDASEKASLRSQIKAIEIEYLQKKTEALNKIETPQLTAQEKKDLSVFISKTDKIFDPNNKIDIALNKENLKKLKKINDLYLKLLNGLIKDNETIAILRSMEEDEKDIDALELLRELKAERDRLIEIIQMNEGNDDERIRKKNIMFLNKNSVLLAEKENKKNELKKKITELKPRYFQLNFLSFGYRASNSKFVRFIDSLETADQLKTTEYVSHSFNVSYNIVGNIKNFNATNFNASTYRYLSIGADFTYTSNQSSLEQVEVTDTRFVSDDETRQVTKEQKAFLGNYKEDLAGATAYLDYYSFLSNNPNFAAVHINPSVVFKEEQKPIANLQLGVLIPFTKKKEQKSIVNVELFYRFKDIFNNMSSDNTLLNRNIIGLQTSFPFNF